MGWIGCSALTLAQGVPAATNLPPTAVVPNRAPLLAPPFTALPLGGVRPRGWLLTQCQQQRDGLTGNAEAVYAVDIGTNSAWLGGTGDSWERSPYYYKGLIPLAYVLNDAGLKLKAQKWIDWLLTHQGTDGYLGPAANNDWWPRMLATYALRDYYEATGDARVPAALNNYFHYMLVHLPTRPLSDWGKARAGDEMDVALWLYNRNGDTNLLTLVNLLHRQAYDWTGIFTSNNFDSYGTDFQPKHNVNVEQALKLPDVYYQLSGQPADRNALALGWDNLMREHGLSCGLNGGTEFLAGNASVQGVELCSIVEAMLSLETSLRTTGDPVLADRLETISFNALPAALANHIKGIQYFTLPNNVIAINGGHGYNQDYANGSVPGPNSGFPCCRYNFHMGWPKYVQNSWAATADGGLAALAYGPTVVNALVGGQPVQITEDTGYPFEEQLRLQISVASPLAFPLALRIPGWCSHAAITVNGQPQTGVQPASFFRLQRTWTNGDTVVINLPMPIQTQPGPSRSLSVNRGPVVYSLKIGEQWTVSTPDPLGLGFDEYQVRATTPWAYALQLNLTNLADSLAFTNYGTPANPFDPAQPSVALTAQARQLPEWTIGWRGTHAFEPPVSPVASSSPLETVTLVPFGSQHLRVSWFPYLGAPSPTVGSFTDNFDSGWSRRWTVFGGNWTVRNGVLNTVPASANGAKALAMATAFTNFTYEADVSAGSVGDAGLVFRASQPDIGADAYCGYYVGLSPSGANLQLGYANNGWHSLTNVSMPFAANTAYHLKVSAQGSRLRIFVNGADLPAIDLRDTTFSRGMIGVRTYCTDGDKSVSSYANPAAHELPVAPAGGPHA
ncbi:MAG: glycoside hydrolase family 127 protein [Verrucomicrobiae bacterium]|nr:glycoside hydrolase family 127 protein [Verrucomicrobiae bacterium]